MEKIPLESDDRICFKCNKYLHRYHPIDSKLTRSLRENYLWFSDPLDFNDPYDCNLETKIEFDFAITYNYLSQENKKRFIPMTDEYILTRTMDIMDNPKTQLEIIEGDKKNDLETVKKTGICCFSQKDDILLMWSHYANKHKGVCLVFDIKKDHTLFNRKLYNLEYPEKYPIYNWPKDENTFSTIRLLIATKSKDWQYEDEVRLVREKGKENPFRGKVKFDKKCLVAIKFGYKSEIDEIKNINNLLIQTGNYEHVKFYKAKLKKLEFGLEFNELPRNTLLA